MKPSLKPRRARVAMLLLLLSVIVAGCSLGNLPSTPVPAPGPPAPPINPHPPPEPPHPQSPPGGEFIVGDGPPALLEGKVVFADTDLGLWGRVTFEDVSVTTDTGYFDIELPQGVNTYTISTLMGDHTATVLHDGAGIKQLSFPPFENWESYFRTMLHNPQIPGTVRWPRGAHIPVWIEGRADNDNVTDAGVDAARSSFTRWSTVLSDTITFYEIDDKALAQHYGIVIEYVPKDELRGYGPGTIGVCRVNAAKTGDEDWAVINGHIRLSHNDQDSPSLVLHEIGHCIGLSGHSFINGDVMYPSSWRYAGISAGEGRATQLLYSVPQGSVLPPPEMRS